MVGTDWQKRVFSCENSLVWFQLVFSEKNKFSGFGRATVELQSGYIWAKFGPYLTFGKDQGNEVKVVEFTVSLQRAKRSFGLQLGYNRVQLELLLSYRTNKIFMLSYMRSKQIYSVSIYVIPPRPTTTASSTLLLPIHKRFSLLLFSVVRPINKQMTSVVPPFIRKVERKKKTKQTRETLKSCSV